MKKAIMIFNSRSLAVGALEYAAELNNAGPFLLTGIFLPEVVYRNVMVAYLGGLGGPMYLPEQVQDTGWIEEGKAEFSAYCIKNGIEFRIHDGIISDIENELAKETRYADLLILAADQLYSDGSIEDTAEYIGPTLHHAECPILVIPGTYKTIDQVIFAYDGSASCMHALRQFTYLMPFYTGLHITIAEAGVEEGELPDLAYIKEYAARHFAHVELLKLDIEPKKYFSTWLTGKNAMLITGSFGRSRFSEVFKKGFITPLIKEQKLPVFIAHK